MARSGSYDFSVDRDQIINAAFRLIGVLGTDQTASTTMLDEASQALNLMIKGWQGRGYGLWLNREIVLFSQKDQVKYPVGPTMQSANGDYACLFTDFVKTALVTAAAVTDTTLTVDSITDITDGDFIGIITNDQDIHWTTVNGVPAGSSVVITDGMDVAANSSNFVYTGFTTVPERPLEILKAWRRDPTELDVDIIIQSLDEYRTQTNKITPSPTITQLAYDRLLDNGVIYLWPLPNDMRYRTHLIVKYPVEDFDSAVNDPDFPQEWFNALKFNLAVQISADYSRMPSPIVIQMAGQSLEDALGYDNEMASSRFVPDLTSYRRRSGYGRV